MGRALSLEQKSYTLKLNSTNEEIYNCLHFLTDEDFNGNNGTEYFTIMETPEGDKKISHLDASMMFIGGFTNLSEFIEDVIKKNYSDDYYSDYKLSIVTVYDSLVIVLSTLS